MPNASLNGPLRRTPLALIGVMLALAGLAAGCGGSSAKSSASTTSTTIAAAGGNFAAVRARLTQCLETHGVPASVATAGFGRGTGSRFAGSTTSAPGSNGSAPSSTPRRTIPSQYQAAFQACRSLFGGAGRNLNSPALAAYRNCLQVHGVTLPSTPGGGSSTDSSPPPSFSGTTNPAFAAARQACASLLPARSPASTTPSTT